jgi:nucleotide-binding universal stress UspA family protein
MTRRNVVVAVDPAKHWGPVHLGARIAHMLDAPMVVISVFPHHDVLDGPEDEGQRRIREQAEGDLRELARGLPGVEAADAKVLAGSSPARSLQELSERDDTLLVVVGSTTQGALRRIVPGSVAERLVSGAACPVAVAPQSFGEEAPAEPSLIGVAFDGSEESRRALDAGTQVARLASARLRVITVHEPLAFGNVPPGPFPVDASVNSMLEQRLRHVQRQAMAELSGVPDVEAVFERGRAADVLAAQSRQLDLLVTSSRGYGPLGAVLLGGTTHDLLHSAESPLLITPRGRGLELGDG